MEKIFNRLMPGFFEKMPTKKRGIFKVSVESYNFRRTETVWQKRFTERRRAYIAVRLKALWWDWMSPEFWHITEVEQ